MKAVVLAGGKGKRLEPLSQNIPKPLVPILNNPIIDYIIRLLNHNGIDQICLALGFGAQKIIDFLVERYGQGKVNFAVEQTPLGTAGAVKSLKDFVGQDDFLVISGDCFCDINLQKMLRFFERTDADAVLAACTVDDPSQYGVIDRDAKNRIVGFVEKPVDQALEHSLVNCGIYAFKNSVLQMIPDQVFYDFSNDLFPKMLKNNCKVFAFENGFYWTDIGSINSYHKANMDALARKIKFKAFEGGLEGIMNACDSIIGPNTTAVIRHKEAQIPPNCAIFPYSILGKNCTLKQHTVVANSVVLQNANLQASAVNCIAYENDIISAGGDTVMPHLSASDLFVPKRVF